jgi:PAS domain S-box-containing protein
VNLSFTYLPAYAAFLLENKLHEYAIDQLELARAVDFPLLKFFKNMDDAQLLALSKENLGNFFDFLIRNAAQEQIEDSLQQWSSNMLPLIDKEQVVAEDITLTAFLRKASFAKFLPDYTSDLQLFLHIIREIDEFNAAMELASFKLFSNIQRSKIDETLVQLQESDGLYKQSQALTHIGNWTWNIADNKITWSDELFRIYGLEPQSEELSFERFIGLVHPEDRAGRIQQIQDSIVTQVAPDYTMRIVTDKGELKILQGRNQVVVDEQGNSAKLLGTCQDITSAYYLRKQMEYEKSLAEALIENSVDVIYAFDSNFNLIVFNGKAEGIFGIARTEILGKPITAIDLFKHNKQLLADLETAYRGNTTHYKEKVIARPDRYFEQFIIPVIGLNEESLGVLVLSHDITDIKNAAANLDEANRILEQKNRELERSNKELTAFSYVASHDLQEPLRKIKTFNSLIIQKDGATLTDNTKQVLEKIDTSVVRMQTLIRDLLSFSRTHNDATNFEQVDLNKIISDVYASYNDLANARNIIINSDQLPVITGIPFQLTQLFSNLVSNSIKYGKGECCNVRITAKKVAGHEVGISDIDRRKSYHYVMVSDDGIGFDPNQAEKIFEIFQRLHNRQEYSGTGIGLAICKKIVQNHNGVITASSKEKEGSTFHIYLPCSEN